MTKTFSLAVAIASLTAVSVAQAAPLGQADIAQIHAKQAHNRAHVARLVNGAEKRGVTPVFMAHLERIRDNQAKARAQLAEKIGTTRAPFGIDG